MSTADWPRENARPSQRPSVRFFTAVGQAYSLTFQDIISHEEGDSGAAPLHPGRIGRRSYFERERERERERESTCREKWV
jgi:hypothetical protein